MPNQPAIAFSGFTHVLCSPGDIDHALPSPRCSTSRSVDLFPSHFPIRRLAWNSAGNPPRRRRHIDYRASDFVYSLRNKALSDNTSDARLCQFWQCSSAVEYLQSSRQETTAVRTGKGRDRLNNPSKHGDGRKSRGNSKLSVDSKISRSPHRTTSSRVAEPYNPVSSKARSFPDQGSHRNHFNRNRVSVGDAILNGTEDEKLAVMREVSTGSNVPCCEEINEVLTALCRSRRMDDAHWFMDSLLAMPFDDRSRVVQNVKTYTIMIDVCGKSGQLARAITLFYGMQCEGLKPNAVTYNSIIAACARNNEPDLAFCVFREMEEANVKSDKFTFGALIDACAKCGKVDLAFEFAELMDEKKIHKDQTIYSALMDACGRANLIDRAFEVYEDMKKSGVFPNLITFSLLIDTCANAREPEKAFQIFSEIRHWGFPHANVVVYTALINCCSKSGCPERSRDVLKSMVQHDISPNAITFGAYIDGWTRAEKLEEAFEALDEMIVSYKCEPNAVLLGGLVDTARRLREYEWAKKVWEVMVQFNVKVSRIFYPSLMAMAAKNGDIDVAIGIAFYVLGTPFLRRCALNSEEPFLRVLANAIVYIKYMIDYTKDEKLRKTRQSRMAVFFESTMITADDMAAIDPEDAFLQTISWGDNQSRRSNLRRRREPKPVISSSAKHARAIGLRRLKSKRMRSDLNSR